MADEFDANEFLSDVGIEDNGSDLVKKLRKAVERLGKEKQAVVDELAAFKGAQAKAALEDTWSELKVPEPLRGFYKGDETPEAIKAWWDSSKGFFNLPAEDGQETAAATQETQQHAELQDVAKAATLGSDPAGNLSETALKQFAAEASKLSAHRDADKLAEALTKLGIPRGGITVPQQG